MHQPALLTFCWLCSLIILLCCLLLLPPLFLPHPLFPRSTEIPTHCGTLSLRNFFLVVRFLLGINLFGYNIWRQVRFVSSLFVSFQLSSLVRLFFLPMYCCVFVSFRLCSFSGKYLQVTQRVEVEEANLSNSSNSNNNISNNNNNSVGGLKWQAHMTLDHQSNSTLFCFRPFKKVSSPASLSLVLIFFHVASLSLSFPAPILPPHSLTLLFSHSPPMTQTKSASQASSICTTCTPRRSCI